MQNQRTTRGRRRRPCRCRARLPACWRVWGSASAAAGGRGGGAAAAVTKGLVGWAPAAACCQARGAGTGVGWRPPRGVGGARGQGAVGLALPPPAGRYRCAASPVQVMCRRLPAVSRILLQAGGQRHSRAAGGPTAAPAPSALQAWQACTAGLAGLPRWPSRSATPLLCWPATLAQPQCDTGTLLACPARPPAPTPAGRHLAAYAAARRGRGGAAVMEQAGQGLNQRREQGGAGGSAARWLRCGQACTCDLKCRACSAAQQAQQRSSGRPKRRTSKCSPGCKCQDRVLRPVQVRGAVCTTHRRDWEAECRRLGPQAPDSPTEGLWLAEGLGMAPVGAPPCHAAAWCRASLANRACKPRVPALRSCRCKMKSAVAALLLAATLVLASAAGDSSALAAIVGGQNATGPGRYPYMAGLFMSADSARPFCGGGRHSALRSRPRAAVCRLFLPRCTAAASLPPCPSRRRADRGRPGPHRPHCRSRRGMKDCGFAVLLRPACCCEPMLL